MKQNHIDILMTFLQLATWWKISMLSCHNWIQLHVHYLLFTLYFVSARIFNSIKSLLILIEFVKINVVRTHPLTPRFTGSKTNYFVSTRHLLIKLISLWRHSSSSQNPRWRDVPILNLDWLIIPLIRDVVPLSSIC